MFSRKSCYFFVRPKRTFSKSAFFSPHLARHGPAGRPLVTDGCALDPVRHRDEVEAPLTDWLEEAYEKSETLSAKPKPKARKTKKTRRKRQ